MALLKRSSTTGWLRLSARWRAYGASTKCASLTRCPYALSYLRSPLARFQREAKVEVSGDTYQV